jgi:hypothetical protein
MLARSRFGHLAMLFRQHFRWRDIGDSRHYLVLETADNITIAVHHRIEADTGDVGRIVLLGLADAGVEHVRPFEEFRIRRAWHEAGNGE